MPSARRTAWPFVTGIAAAGLLGVAFLAVQIWPQYVYAQERTAAYNVVAQLLDRRPDGVPAPVWDVAATWAATAYANVCFSADHVPIDELRRFRADVEQRLAGQVDLATIEWLWQRLAETGPTGQQYCSRFEPAYRAHLKAALAKQ
jgi:hypothetical protein